MLVAIQNDPIFAKVTFFIRLCITLTPGPGEDQGKTRGRPGGAQLQLYIKVAGSGQDIEYTRVWTGYRIHQGLDRI